MRRAYPRGLDEALGDAVEERMAKVQHPVLLLQAAAHLVRERPRLRLHAAAHLPLLCSSAPLLSLLKISELGATAAAEPRKTKHECKGQLGDAEREGRSLVSGDPGQRQSVRT